MAVLHRSDGVQFALRPYRELLSAKKASLFRKELELLAQNHGNYVRLFAQPRGAQEAVFSREPGYLLGESVWRYLDKPDYLIYCEALPEKQESIVVIVREGAVYLDAVLPFAELEEELEALKTSIGQFEIYIHGSVPFALQEYAASIKQLPKSLFATLPTDPDVQLLPSQRIIEELTPSRSYMSWVIGGIVVLALFAWVTHTGVKEEKTEVVDPMAQYRATFSGQPLSAQLTGLVQQVELLYGLPGWVANSITYTSSGLSVAVNSLGGTTGMLLAWAKHHNVQVNLGSQGAALTMSAPMSHEQPTIPVLTSLQLIFSTVIDKMMVILPNKSVSIGSITNEVGYKKAGLTIQVNGIAPYVLSLIGTALQGLPVVLTNCALTFKDGLLSGTIELSALGS